MRDATLYFIMALIFGCTAQPYTWQDTRQPVREDPARDLEECQEYAGRQYRPGIPAGEAFLTTQERQAEERNHDGYGEWRPDRSPFPVMNNNSQPIHKVPVDYTGYPAELDYAPHYLDDILGKCMRDRGWSYQPAPAPAE